MTEERFLLYFLGTGGGRHVMTSQRRRTAGIRLVHGDTQIHIDPGPGALVFSNWADLSPQKLDGLIVTHCHPDHYNDAEVFIEAMTRGTTSKRGVLAATTSVLKGSNGIGPSISDYHQSLVKDIVELREDVGFNIGELNILGTGAKHSDPFTVGLRMNTPLGEIGYTSDTGYFSSLSDSYKDLRLLILCAMWPRGRNLNIHLNTDDALKLIAETKPNACILTHFGMRMLNSGPEKEEEYLAEETNTPVYAATDGLLVSLGEKIILRGPSKKDEPIEIDA